MDRSTTVITVTHRLGLLVDYDYVLVMDQGQLIQAGSREELLATDGYLKEAMDGFRHRAEALHSGGRTEMGEGN